MINKVVARRIDGMLIKGTTGDFSPDKNTFHVHDREHGKYDVHTIKLNDLKAVFFVKSLQGDKAAALKKHKEVIFENPEIGKHIRVFFHDGEVVDGRTHSFHLDKMGFFMTPIDKKSNNERIFVVLQSVEKIKLDDQMLYFPLTNVAAGFCGICGRKMQDEWKYCPFDGAVIAQ